MVIGLLSLPNRLDVIDIQKKYTVLVWLMVHMDYTVKDKKDTPGHMLHGGGMVAKADIVFILRGIGNE